MQSEKPKKQKKNENIERLRQHRMWLNKALNNALMPPSRHILAVFLALWLDTHGDEHKFIQNWIEAVWISPKRIRWAEDDDPVQQVGHTNEDKETANKLKSLFAGVLEEKQANGAIQN